MFASLFFLAQGAQLCICSHWFKKLFTYQCMRNMWWVKRIFFLFNPIDREDILRWLVCEEKVGKIK